MARQIHGTKDASRFPHVLYRASDSGCQFGASFVLRKVRNTVYDGRETDDTEVFEGKGGEENTASDD